VLVGRYSTPSVVSALRNPSPKHTPLSARAPENKDAAATHRLLGLQNAPSSGVDTTAQLELWPNHPCNNQSIAPTRKHVVIATTSTAAHTFAPESVQGHPKPGSPLPWLPTYICFWSSTQLPRGWGLWWYKVWRHCTGTTTAGRSAARPAHVQHLCVQHCSHTHPVQHCVQPDQPSIATFAK
jgi:hypothetical protein